MTGLSSGPSGGPASGPAADRRLGPYTVLAVAGFVAALVTGQAAFAAIAAPAAVLVVVALSDRRPLHVDLHDVEAPARVLEGDHWQLRFALRWSGEAEVDIVHTGVAGSAFAGIGPDPSVEVDGVVRRATGGTVVELDVVATGWGRHDLGTVVVRARRPGGMLRWDHTFALDGSVRVLPHASRLDELLRPSRPRIASGAHLTPVRGAGSDFADLRPYVPGDRLRDVSWTASARSEAPWVVVHHPERAATVVLLLDGFVEVGAPTGSLDRAARVVWSIARHHLAAGDRVGLAATGSIPTWLSPVAGRRARWQVLDALLTVGASVAGAPRGARRTVGVGRRRSEPAATLGADAVIVGVTPLQSDAFVAEAVHHRRLGRPTVVVGVRTDDLLPPACDEVERAARRLWALDAEVRTANLSRAGIPTAFVADDPSPAIRLLAQRDPSAAARRPA